MQYTPFASDIELPFYTALASRKIDHDKLDDSARQILGLYEIRPTDSPHVSCRMQIHGDALTSERAPEGYYQADGVIQNFNTIEEYRDCDKAARLQLAGKRIWDAILDGTIYTQPSLLASFLVLSYADLKKYRFHYWFGFPALHSDPSWIPATESSLESKATEVGSSPSSAGGWRVLSATEGSALADAVQAWSRSIDSSRRGFFLARKTRTSLEDTKTQRPDMIAPGSSATEIAVSWNIAPLAAYENGFFDGVEHKDRYIGFADPSNYEEAAGWMLRNLLVLVRQRWKVDEVQILRYRDMHSKRDQVRSSVITMKSPAPAPADTVFTADAKQISMPKVTGWERNPSGKLAGRMVNLTEYMDPKRLADQSVDLNLKLMKWRISPNLDLSRIKKTKCLLLGAGTLGSYVARNLMAWGVTTITFVDNGSVSFSNPVRQPLFNFNDCLNGGARKAYRASQALSEIYPGVESTGHVLSVPMAGHPVIDNDRTRKEFETLKRLVDEHDAIFLLMDTRESRWLPTVMGRAAGKIVMNAALGFDTFVVMRHGVKNAADPASELGCYFCNDVVAPANVSIVCTTCGSMEVLTNSKSVRDQTLDQQCTVTRPGVAAIASALLVELFVSLLQHSMGAAAPAPVSRSDDRGEHPLGLIPHQIRGFLSTFENMSVVGRSYRHCSACSDNVVDAYRKDDWAFVQKALNEREYIEELSGLKEVQALAEATADDIVWDDSFEEEDEPEIL